MAFSFCFFFFCASLLKRKRRAKKSNNGKERVIFSFLQAPGFYNPSGAVAPAPFTGGSLGFVRTLQADLRGVVGAAPYRVCANIAGTYLAHRRGDHWSPAIPAKSNSVGGHSICPRLQGILFHQPAAGHARAFWGQSIALFQKFFRQKCRCGAGFRGFLKNREKI